MDLPGLVLRGWRSNEMDNTTYYTTREIWSANMGFESANIGWYYTVQQLIAQLRQV